MNVLRQKLSTGKRLFGTHIYTADIRITEIAGQIGFDYLWIDTEHAPTDYKMLENHLIAAKATGTPAMVRIPWNDPVLAKRALEMGPDAIIFPMIYNEEDARLAIDACLYPPLGTRGFGPQRAIRYGLMSTDEYMQVYTEETMRILQLETESSVLNLEKIAAIPFVDAFIIGPMDLSGSVNDLGNFTTGRTNELIDLAIRTAHDCGKPIGISFGGNSRELTEHWLSKDLDFISVSSDMDAMINSLRLSLGTLQELDSRA